jgi:hypothetical protein
MLLFMLSVFLGGCSRKLQSTPDSAKIEVAEISDGHFLYRPIIIFVDDQKVEDYSAPLLPKETTIKAVVQKDYDVTGLYIQEPITKIIAQSPSAEIIFIPEPREKYDLFGKVINKKAILWIEDHLSSAVVAGTEPD